MNTGGLMRWPTNFIFAFSFLLLTFAPVKGEAKEVWPWPLSVTCQVNLDHLEGWWSQEDSGVSWFFNFRVRGRSSDDSTLVEMNEFSSAGDLIVHGHANVRARERSLKFEIYETLRPNELRVAYVHQLDFSQSKTCSGKKITTVVSFVKLGPTPSKDELQEVYYLQRND